MSIRYLTSSSSPSLVYLDLIEIQQNSYMNYLTINSCHRFCNFLNIEIMGIILLQVFTSSFPFLTMSSYTLSHKNGAWSFSFRKETFTLLGSSIYSISNYFSISLTMSINSSWFRILEQVDTSILHMPFNSNNSFNNLSPKSSSSLASEAFI